MLINKSCENFATADLYFRQAKRVTSIIGKANFSPAFNKNSKNFNK